jgi:hypothetical protein
MFRKEVCKIFVRRLLRSIAADKPVVGETFVAGAGRGTVFSIIESLVVVGQASRQVVLISFAEAAVRGSRWRCRDRILAGGGLKLHLPPALFRHDFWRGNKKRC